MGVQTIIFIVVTCAELAAGRCGVRGARRAGAAAGRFTSRLGALGVARCLGVCPVINIMATCFV